MAKVISDKGRANLLVSRDARQGVATFSEITFGKRHRKMLPLARPSASC